MIQPQNNYVIYTDGGARSNPGPAACAFVVKDKTEKVIFQGSQYLGRATNNEAEYFGVILALNWLTTRKDQLINSKLIFFLDSKLVVNQLNSLYKIKNTRLKALVLKIKVLESQIKHVITYQSIPREQNQLADKLLNDVLDMKTGAETI